MSDKALCVRLVAEGQKHIFNLTSWYQFYSKSDIDTLHGSHAMYEHAALGISLNQQHELFRAVICLISVLAW